VLPHTNKLDNLARIREDIRAFKKEKGVEKVIVLWTGNTERMSKLDCPSE
jgi:hypothetical protein